MRFAGKRVLITGGAGGIGLATAKAFLAEGAVVAINDLTEEAVRKAVAAVGDGAFGVPGDVSDPATAADLVARAVALLGGLDVLVSNAGIYPSHPFLEMTPEQFDQVMGVNARGTFLVCQAAARTMVAGGNGGAIVTVSSGSARFARVGAAHYCASKAAVVMLTRTMALELAPFGIRVNSVAPGLIDIPGGPVLAEAYRQAMTRMVPQGRMGRPEDIASAILMTADPANAYLNGAVIPVDGGLSAGRFGIPTSG